MLAPTSDSSVEHFFLVFVTVLHSIAVVMTCLRLWVRLRLHRLWWEDAWAFLALCLDVIFAVSTWTLGSPQRDNPWHMSESHIVSIWLKLLSYTCAIWAARISIMFSLLRVIPPSCRMWSITSGFIGFLVFLWALCVASKIYICSSNRSWYNLPELQCPLGLPIVVIEFATDVVSDFILVLLPTQTLYRMRLPKNERILIISIFSMSLLNVIVNILHVTFLLPIPGFMASITANIEGAVDLMNCNLLVLVTTLYRSLRNGEDIERTVQNCLCLAAEPSESSSVQTTMDTLTTVDLERFETMSVHSTQSAPIPQSRGIPLQTVSSRSCFDVSMERS